MRENIYIYIYKAVAVCYTNDKVLSIVGGIVPFFFIFQKGEEKEIDGASFNSQVLTKNKKKNNFATKTLSYP